MPGTPRIDKGEGLIRTYDLLRELQRDIDIAYEALENDKQSQYLRRCVVRAIFSYIEALVECIKVELRSSVRSKEYVGEFTERDMETLGSLGIFGAKSNKFLPIDQNLKRTFRLAAKLWGLGQFRLKTDGDEYREFLSAKHARNRLTHSRTFYDIEVTATDMHCHTSTALWARSEFQRLWSMRVDALSEGLPADVRDRLVSLVRKQEEGRRVDA